MVGGPRERKRAAEVMRHQMNGSRLDLTEQPVEVCGVMRDAVAPIGGFVGGTETRQLRCDDAGELGDRSRQCAPVGAGVVAVHEEHRLTCCGSTDEYRTADTVDSDHPRLPLILH